MVQLEFDSADDANEAQPRLLEPGVLDRSEDKHGPTVVVETARPSRRLRSAVVEENLQLGHFVHRRGALNNAQSAA